VSKFVLDSSALLACLNQEPGSEEVIDTVAGALMSTVNLAETVAVLVRRGASKQKAIEILQLWEFELVDFDRSAAEEAGALVERTRSNGLSLGDRACLSLALARNLPAITADRAWRDLDIGVNIRFLR
jgi:PIN domain nuclease of toxin-antitoxin system